MESCNSLEKVLAIPTSNWSRLRLLIQATGILRAAGRSPFEETAAVDVEYQELITRPFLNHSDQQVGDKVRNPRQSWVRIHALIRFIGLSKIVARRPSTTNYVQETAAVDLMLDNDMDLQEQIARPFVNHSDQQAGDKVRNPRQCWVRILALVRFIVVAKLATRRPSRTSYVQDLESGPITDDDAELESLDDESCGEMQVLQRNYINRIVQEKNWDELYDFGGVIGFAEALDSHLENGIAGDKADIGLRNAVIKFPQTCIPVVFMFFYLLFEALKGWTISLLAVATILSFAFGIDEEGIQNCWLDNLILLMSVLGLIMFKFGRIYWEDKILMKKMEERKVKMHPETKKVRVIRGGVEGVVPFSDLVYGDIIFLRSGDLVPANGIFVSNCGEALEVRDDDDDDDVELCINEQNPFLSLGSKVIKGDAKMIVTSCVGDEADQWTERMRQAITKSTSHTGFGFDACFEKLRFKINVAGLVISILSFVVLFVRFKLRQTDEEHEYELEIEKEPAKFSQIVNSITKVSRDSKLRTLLCVSLVGMTEGLSLVVSRAIVYWKRKIVSYKDYSKIDTALLLKLEASVTIVCSVKNGWLTQQNHQEIIRDIAVKTLTEGEVKTIFVSEDDADEFKNIIREVGLINKTDSDDALVVNGEDFHELTDADKMEKIDRICIMGNASLPHKLLLVKCLKLKGEVVLMLGERTFDGLVIQKADFGMYIDTWSFDYAIGMLKLGRFISGNVRKFIQIELILTLASWVINLITVMIMGDAPLTALQLIWLNFLITFPGGLALFSGQSSRKMEDERRRLSDIKTRSKPLITKAMWRNVIIQVTYQIVIFVALLCKGRNIHGISNQEVCKSIIFNGLAFCQFFSILCAREPEKKNIFIGCCNYLLWAAFGVLILLQLAFGQAAPLFSDTARLNWKLWVVCFLIGAATCLFDWAGKCASEYIAQYFASISTRQSPLVNEYFTRCAAYRFM